MRGGSERSELIERRATARPFDVMAKPDDAPLWVWERVTEADIKVLRIPTPFQVGRVNCYLIEDEPLTLIDAGPSSARR